MTSTTADWTEMDTLKYNQRALEAALTEQDQRITDLTALIEEFAKHLHITQQNLATAEDRLDPIEKRLEFDRDDILDLRERLDAVETRLHITEERLTTLEGR